MAVKYSSAYVGLHKSCDAGICLLPVNGPLLETEIILKERFVRVKHAGGPLDHFLFKIAKNGSIAEDCIAENFAFWDPINAEQRWNESFPYFDNLKRLGLASFTRHFNPNLRFFTHHYCHARSAAALSPFEKSLIIVNDGGGNPWSDFTSKHEEAAFPPPPALTGHAREFYTVYRQSGSRLSCVEKKWQPQNPASADEVEGAAAGDISLGWLFTRASQYVFNSDWAQGKVMGLAAFGRPGAMKVKKRKIFFKNLDKGKRFTGSGKWAWEGCDLIEHYADISAAVQEYFEQWLLDSAADLKRRFPREENLILTGGCALNCVANMKLAQSGLFSSIYVPPFPGDESTAFGAACSLRYENPNESWQPWPWKSQVPNFGPRESEPDEKSCRIIFSGWNVRRLKDPAVTAAELLGQHKVIAWFQGRSESGPRALGFRSIFANALQPGIKEYLNEVIKGRERFRPYGCSVLWEKASRYFCVPRGFESPFMSFAPRVREEYRDLLGEIAHKDGTSRIQTVRKSQNPLLHRCLQEVERSTGVGCILNTSLNVMGEPIVETLRDLRLLLEKVPLDAAIAGGCLIENPIRKAARRR